MSGAQRNRRNTAQESGLVPGDKLVPPVHAETHAGPWPWQWSGLRSLVLATPPRSITIRALMDDIRKDAPEMYRTITDSKYSESLECPFVIDTPSMGILRRKICEYENDRTFLSPDAQIGMRKSIATALGECKGLGQRSGTLSAGGSGSKSRTTPADLGTAGSTKPTSPKPLPPPKRGVRNRKKVMGAGRADGRKP